MQVTSSNDGQRNADALETQTQAVGPFLAVESALAELRTRMAGVLYDVSTTKGMAAAKVDRAEVRALRIAVESRRMELTAPYLQSQRAIAAQAKDIAAQLSQLEDPLDQQIKAEETRKEAERVARASVERLRITAIHEHIASIGAHVQVAQDCRTPEAVQRLVNQLRDAWANEPDGSYGEFAAEAQTAYTRTLERLEQIGEQKGQEQAERDRLKAEREQVRMERAALAAQAAEQLQTAQLQQAAAERLKTERVELQRQREALKPAPVVKPAEPVAVPQAPTPAAPAVPTASAPPVTTDHEPSNAELVFFAARAVSNHWGISFLRALELLNAVEWPIALSTVANPSSTNQEPL
jgi:hypothetical protein